MQLANIVDGLRLVNKKDKDADQTTLIVATPALVNQWYEEIYKHCDMKYLGKIAIYKASKRMVTSDPLGELRRNTIVLTTYTEVLNSYPKTEFPAELQTHEEKVAYWDQFLEENKGDLHRMSFLRVVLDEAQAIKNRSSRTSTACRALISRFRWAITGTPILNSTEELYPYFKFLKVPNTGSFKVFRENFLPIDDQLKIDRLHLLLGRFLLRRVHSDKLFNRPLIKLPKIHENTQSISFSNFERNVYEIVRKRMIARINVMSKQGELKKNYTNILTMILRLRALTVS